MTLAGIVCVVGTQVATAADVKIAVVNMAELMKGYDKAQRAERQLKEQAEDYRADQEERRTAIRDLGEAYREASAEADDAALSEAAKTRKKDEAIEHLTKLKEAELDYRKFAREAERKLSAESRRMRETLVDDLRLKVQEYARNSGYGLVLDSVTVVHAVAGEVDDITKPVAAQLGAAE
jgi:Skp family chaperone for outer membrane proteins